MKYANGRGYDCVGMEMVRMLGNVFAIAHDGLVAIDEKRKEKKSISQRGSQKSTFQKLL